THTLSSLVSLWLAGHNTHPHPLPHSLSGSCPAAPHVAPTRARLHRPLAAGARRRRCRRRQRPEGHRAPPRPARLPLAGPLPARRHARPSPRCQGRQARVLRRGASAAGVRRRRRRRREGQEGGGRRGG
ncbi:Os05g0230700, partial [Oryza sativa Japonica Group]